MNFFFCIFLKSPHQVDMKNVVECKKELFAYFNALETYSECTVIVVIIIQKFKSFIVKKEIDSPQLLQKRLIVGPYVLLHNELSKKKVVQVQCQLGCILSHVTNCPNFPIRPHVCKRGA